MKVAIQRGHFGVTVGETGTQGEIPFNSAVAVKVKELLEKSGLQVALLDAAIPKRNDLFDVFISVHADGSMNPDANGFSVGYPDDAGALARALKLEYEKTGIRFRGFNTTRALKNYYAFRKVRARAKAILECGFLTNPSERAWLNEHLDIVAGAIVRAVLSFLCIREETARIDLRLDDELLLGREERGAAFLDEQGCALVPLRILAERLGFNVLWENERKVVTLLRKGEGKKEGGPGMNE